MKTVIASTPRRVRELIVSSGMKTKRSAQFESRMPDTVPGLDDRKPLPARTRGAVRAFSTFLLLQVTVLGVGCLSEKTKSVEPPATCAKAGDSCMFSPGKLGTCVETAGANQSLVCQSLH